MNEDELRKILSEKQKDRRMSCATAMSIADKAGVPRKEVGRLLNEMEIKIHSCQLGCFD